MLSILFFDGFAVIFTIKNTIIREAISPRLSFRGKRKILIVEVVLELSVFISSDI